MPKFSHLHSHTQYSLLDGAASVAGLFKKAVKDGMTGIAITDHGNMFGVFDFVAQAGKFNTKENPNLIKPIVGCEFYVVENRHIRSFSKDKKDDRFHQLFLAKNRTGYQNLVKLCSLGYIEGLYGKYPRIDKELILQYHEGLIATTCCLGAMVPQMILRKGEKEAEKEFEWWLNLFGEDYYIELQRHNINEQNTVNQVLLRFAKKYQVKVICSNDSHYVDQDDYNAHDILLCINTGEKQSTPGFDDFINDSNQIKNRRFKFPNDQFYFKTQAEMAELFKDVPESLDNTQEIVDKVDILKLKQDILLPHYQIPTTFKTQDEYLRDLTFQGAKKRYITISPEIEERLLFELRTIELMGFAGYFLIVQDFINQGREIGVLVGPGRGSAAGSAVAYCIGITNIDPIKYGLLFERFLNPDRKSMPDIDTDFDDEGREKVIDYVVKKYGQNQVAQIVTYGTMAAKMSIKDVARVMDLPLADANILAKLVPEKPGIELNRVVFAPIEGEKSLKEKENLVPEDIENCKKLREFYNKEGSLESKVLREAVRLEGSVRNTGIHAAGIIIAPKDLTEIIPVCTSKESNLVITQFEGKVIEDAGVIKMDFLGLKTLTILRDACKMIYQNYGVKIVLDEIPLTDEKTYELYQRGETNGTFQFESTGMQKYLRDLRPDKFEDLIAMNALYRPGPLEYIPTFIERKHGREPVKYDLEAMKEYLEETYGITVYQEQVMLLSQKLANFTKGDADTLRKAMGKKQLDVLNKMKDKFMKGCEANGHALDICEKVWRDWEAFASYAFNKSHSTCYAFVAFQTAYLKAHYPAEYMSAVLTHAGSIEKITFFLEECKRMGLAILGPDVNESDLNFAVNKQGKIRIGLSSLKGVGEAAVAEILRARTEGEPFSDIFDFIRRVNLRTINKRVVENLAYSGAFDGFTEIPYRSMYFATDEKDKISFTELLIRYGGGHQKQENALDSSLFGEMGNNSGANIAPPKLPKIEDSWGLMQKLNAEKDIVGMFVSGHPLDDYKMQLAQLCVPVADIIENPKRFSKEFAIGGIITDAQHKTTKNGKQFGTLVLEDQSGKIDIALFGENYLKFKHFLDPNQVLLIKGVYKPSWKSKEDLEFFVNSMQLMSEVNISNHRGITLLLPLSILTKTLLDELDSLCQQNTGTQALKMTVFDETTQLRMEFISTNKTIKTSNELLTSLDRMGVSYSVN